MTTVTTPTVTTTLASTTSTSPSTTTTNPIEECDEKGWYRFQNKCYKIITGFQHIADCNSECIHYEGHLVSIHSYQQNKFILDIMSRFTNETMTWLGAVFYDGH